MVLALVVNKKAYGKLPAQENGHGFILLESKRKQ